MLTSQFQREAFSAAGITFGLFTGREVGARGHKYLLGLRSHDELQGSCIVHGQFRICIGGLRQSPDCSQNLIASRFVKYSGTAFNNSESRRIEHFPDRNSRKPSKVGSVQQARVLISELATIQSRLQAPMLRIRYASDDATPAGDLTTNLPEQLPGVPKMFQGVAKYPAVRWKETIEIGLVEVFDGARQDAVAVSFARFGVFRIDFDARVVAIRGQILERPGQRPRAASNLNHAPRLLGDQCQ
jgi:hypothetical protein